ncbi:hypothetical protein P43SY_007249 [Pythium insidiosum]|uniref:Uncharacterized protein n=1 Tax=Pythium insidiosum TaxID=114742 RepID=A0AAD5Q4V7_PYTIN|nr:hypothetical protein P43SY_007249 [Pythium insidiosum]
MTASPRELSCAFDAATATDCRRPRSCRSCLETEGCALSTSGRCTAASAKRPGSSAARPPAVTDPASSRVWPLVSVSSWASPFNASSASYCAGDDAVCSLCRSLFEDGVQRAERDPYDDVASPDDVLMCRGLDGCLCLETCEIERVRRKIVVSDQPNCPAAPLTSHDEVRPDPRAARLAPPRAASTWTPPESCEFVGRRHNAKGCRPRRPCIDCLMREDCMVDHEGFCVNRTLHGFDRWTGWQRAVEAFYRAHNGSVPWQATVCSSADPQCRRCFVDAWRDHAANRSAPFPPSTCRGWNDCACSLRCIAPDDDGSVVDCWAIETTAFFQDIEGDVLKVALVALGVFALIIMGLRHMSERYRSLAHMAAAHATAVVRHVLPDRALDLFGWQNLRRQLIARELELLAGAEDVAPVVMPPVDLLLTAPSAPDQELLDFEDGIEPPKAPLFVHPHSGATAPVGDNGPRLARSLSSGESDMRTPRRSHPPTPSAPDLSDEDEYLVLLQCPEDASSCGGRPSSAPAAEAT